MALNTGTWIGLTAAGSLALGTWMLPPSPYQRTAGSVAASPAEARVAELRREFRRSQDILRRTRWADSLAPLTIATARGGLAVGGAPRIVDEATLDSVRVRVEEELARAGGAGRAVVGVFFLPSSIASSETVVEDVRRTQDTYIGTLEGEPYCYRVLAAPGRMTPRSSSIRRVSLAPQRRYSNILGSCRLIARYGMPGPALLAWLERGGLGFAADPVYEQAGPMLRPDLVRSPFGTGGPSFWVQSQEVGRCLAGAERSCGRLFLDPFSEADESRAEVQHVVDRSPVSAIREEAYRQPFAHYDNYLLADLEVEFGPERFAAFWRSPHDVPVAFQAAFGMPVGEWTVAWVGTHVGSFSAGPRLPRSASTGTGLLLVACAALAGLWARRRRVA
jgi:hypothetical protein